jgi:beta-galactosidase beta subunit
LKNDLVTVLHRSVVRSAADASHRNRRVSFKSDVQESLKLLDTKPSLTFVWKDSHHKHVSRRTNNDVSNRTRSKADYTDQHIGSRTQSKMNSINVNDLSVQNLFFPLHDVILFQGHGKSQAQDLQLRVVECKAYHNVLMNTKSQIDFDRLLQLHMLDQTEEDNDMSWECHMVVDYCK